VGAAARAGRGARTRVSEHRGGVRGLRERDIRAEKNLLLMKI
jgi:hypothetical protein